MPLRADRVAHWAEIIRQFRQSRLSQPAFCRQRGIAPGVLKNWLYKPPYRQAIEQQLQSRTAPATTPNPRRQPARFVPLTLTAAATAMTPIPHDGAHALAVRLEVRLGSGRAIAVAPGFDPDTLRRLIALLEECP
jgi:hypothetical protein